MDINKKGFTLIEVMVAAVILIIVVLSITVAVKTFVKIRRMQDHKRIAKELTQAIVEEMNYHTSIDINYDCNAPAAGTILSNLCNLSCKSKLTMKMGDIYIKVSSYLTIDKTETYLDSDKTLWEIEWKCDSCPASQCSGYDSGKEPCCKNLSCRMTCVDPSPPWGYKINPIGYSTQVWNVNRKLQFKSP